MGPRRTPGAYAALHLQCHVCMMVSVCVMCVHVCVCGAGVGNCVYLTSTLCPCDPPPLLPPTCPPSCLCSPQVRELAYLPLADDIPVAFNSCRKGPRGVGFFCLGLLTGCRLHLPGSPGVGARPIWPWVSWSGCPPHMAAVSGCSCRVGHGETALQSLVAGCASWYLLLHA